jgi:hypothetical protein
MEVISFGERETVASLIYRRAQGQNHDFDNLICNIPTHHAIRDRRRKINILCFVLHEVARARCNANAEMSVVEIQAP